MACSSLHLCPHALNRVPERFKGPPSMYVDDLPHCVLMTSLLARLPGRAPTTCPSTHEQSQAVPLIATDCH